MEDPHRSGPREAVTAWQSYGLARDDPAADKWKPDLAAAVPFNKVSWPPHICETSVSSNGVLPRGYRSLRSWIERGSFISSSSVIFIHGAFEGVGE